MVSLKEIIEARKRLKGIIRPTPLVISDHMSQMAEAEVYFKLENLQKTGSFKIRGALNKIASLKNAYRKKGVVAASAGNHAQGVAYAASLFGVKSTIVMPENSPLTKYMATKAYGAEVMLKGALFDEAQKFAKGIQKKTGGIFLHGFDDYDVIAGQGTIGLEILEDLPDVRMIVVPVGGGGLISGMAIAIKETKPAVKIIGVQAAHAPSMYLSFKEGRICESPEAQSIADGLAVKKVGEKTFPIIQKYVDDMVVVEEEEIAAAVLFLLEKEKILAEGAGATPLAALMFKKDLRIPPKTAIIISGGNIDVNTISRIIDKGLVKAGRLMRLSVEVRDVPGSLAKVTGLVAQNKANILHIYHDRLAKELPIGATRVELTLETKGHDHIDIILSSLQVAQYKVELIS